MQHIITMIGKIASDVLYIACDRNGLQFEPGNCVEIINPISQIKRSYSIASSPNNCDTLEFYIRVFPSETGVSQYLTTLKRGSVLDLGEVFGYFYPGKECEDKKYVYIATGTGIAPFASAMEFYKHKPLMLLYGARTTETLLEPWRWQDMGIDCRFAISQEKTIYPKRITEYLKDLPIDPSIKYYLCGIDSMIDEVSSYLIERGVSWNQIQTEQFYQKV